MTKEDNKKITMKEIREANRLKEINNINTFLNENRPIVTKIARRIGKDINDFILSNCKTKSN